MDIEDRKINIGEMKDYLNIVPKKNCNYHLTSINNSNFINNEINPLKISILGDKMYEKNYIINNINSINTINLNGFDITVHIKLLDIYFHEKDYEYLKICYGYILIYSIHNKSSFENIKKWISNNRKIIKEIDNYYPLLLLGYNNNKKKARKIPYKDIKEFSEKYYLDLYEISNKEDLKLPIQNFIKKIILLFSKKIVKSKIITINNNIGEISTYLPSIIPIKDNDNNEFFCRIIYKNNETYLGYFKNNKRNGKGKMNYLNDDKYIGNFINDEKNGFGKIYYSNGDKYKGFFKNDKKNGKGIFNYNNKSKFIGNFINDLKEGKGTLYYNDGSIYEGNFKKDKREGFGILTFTNGEMYEGNFYDDKKNGYGKFIYNTNKKVRNSNDFEICKIYKGEWKDDTWNGKGNCVLDNGNEYKGNFIDDEILNDNVEIIYYNGDIYNGEINNFNKNGFGILKYKNGNLFEGTFENDKIIKGIFYNDKNDYNKIPNETKIENLFKNKEIKNYINDIIYEGEFDENNLLNGKGVYINPNEYYYQGYFLNNKKNGIGKIIYVNGNEYNGEFKNDLKEGNGRMNFNNGDIYLGSWKNDKIEGKGFYQFKDGKNFNSCLYLSNFDWNLQIEIMKKSNFDKFEFFKKNISHIKNGSTRKKKCKKNYIR